MDEPIRSHLPNENYRRGWDETFGRKHAKNCMGCALKTAAMHSLEDGEPISEVFARTCDEFVASSRVVMSGEMRDSCGYPVRDHG